MKKAPFLLALLCCLPFGTYAQLYFSCHYREYCDWDSRQERFVNCQGYDENSIFEMNMEQTMFVHTTETIKSAYYISSKEYDERNNVFSYMVRSDVGNKYLYIFDLENKQIRVLITKNNEIRMLRFYVKSMWKDD